MRVVDRCGAKQVMKFGNSGKSVVVDEESSGNCLTQHEGDKMSWEVEYNFSAISLYLLVLVFKHSFYSF